MPPKTLTNTDLTSGSPRMISRPFAMTSAEAPPPMSRKLAGLTSTVRLTGVRDDVEGAHDETRAVADDADLAVELDVVEVLGLRGGLERVGRGLVLERGVVRLAEVGVLVQGHLAVERDDLAGRPVLTSGLTSTRRASSAMKVSHRVTRTSATCSATSAGNFAWRDDLAGLLDAHAFDGVDRDLREGLGVLLRDLLDLHAALRRTPWRGRCGWCGRGGTRRSTPPRSRARSRRSSPCGPCGP